MRLSISARIFTGFLAVLVVFGGVIGYTFLSSDRLRQDLHLNYSYMGVAQLVAEMRAFQNNLLNHIASRIQGGTETTQFSQTHVHQFHRWRERKVRQALRMVRGSQTMNPGQRDRQFLQQIEARLQAIHEAFGQNEALYDRLFTASGSAGTRQISPESLLKLEKQLETLLVRINNDVMKQVKAAADQVDVEENRAIYAILVLVVVAVIVSIMVTFGAQLTLRPLKTLVAGTKRIGSGDYSHRVMVRSQNELGDLADEFNSMATAIEEREQRLIRSERMAAAGQIASHITHEIRNPLSSISLNTELLEEEFESLEGAGAGEARKLCEAVRGEVDRLTEITEEYLRFARLPKPRLESENINEILLNLISFMSTELQQKQIAVNETLQPDLPCVEADENQLRQAFLNLMRNAGEAMAGNGGVLTISSRLADTMVEVTIADTGTGIEANKLNQVFEPFFSTKESGTGLGLALTQQIITEHGGAIDVRSTLGSGTTFTVKLPAGAGREILGSSNRGE